MNRSRHFLICCLLLLLYWAWVLHTALFAPLDLSIFLFSENGTFETFSPVLWLILAAVCLLGSFTPPTRLSTAAAAVLLACREMDLHKALFETSFLKTNFYRDPDIILSHKIIGLALCVLLALLAVYLGKTFWRTTKRLQRPWPVSFHYALLTLVLLAASKICDRLNDQLYRLWDISLSRHAAVVIQSFEESTEMMTPLLLCMAVFFYQPPPASAPQPHRLLPN